MYKMYVKRGDPARYDFLYNAFAERIPVVWERRRGERRRGDAGVADDRRKADRRSAPAASWDALGFVVARASRHS